MKKTSNYKQRLQAITTFVFDVDGVFTNGEIFYHPNGETIRSYNAKDGYAVKEAVDKGYKIAVITRGDSNLVKDVFSSIGVFDVFLAVMDKASVLDSFLTKNNINYNEVLYMGDDIPDLECIKMVGIGTCPRDAVREIRNIADYVSTFEGGKGAVRDVVEQTLRMQGKW